MEMEKYEKKKKSSSFKYHFAIYILTTIANNIKGIVDYFLDLFVCLYFHFFISLHYLSLQHLFYYLMLIIKIYLLTYTSFQFLHHFVETGFNAIN